ncbi:MAG: leucine-rich repeat protein [Clostridiales bacterium]|nr:leucine-rich repeat protein [Clostridiales bacterium]
MKKSIRTILSLLLALSVFLGAVPFTRVGVSALTSGQYTYTVSDGKATITEYTCLYDSDDEPIMIGTLTIPERLGGYPVTAIGERAFQWCEVITGLVIGDNITSLGDYAFYWCENLVTVQIGNGITEIPSCAFLYCKKLESVAFGENVTIINSDAFSTCYKLNNVYMPNNLISIGSSAFKECTSLTNVVLNDGLEAIGNGAFYLCSALSEIVIPDSVTSIGRQAFSKTDSITIYCHQNTFAYTYAVENKLNVSVLRKITALTVTTYPEKMIYTIGEGFDSWGMILTASYDDGTTRNVTDYDITGFSSAVPGNVTITFSYEGMSTQLAIRIIEFFYTVDKDNSVILTGYAGNSTVVNIPEKIGSYTVTKLGDRVFENCGNITGVSIPASITSIGAYAFDGCSNLSSVTIPASVRELDKFTFAGSGIGNINVSADNLVFASSDGVLTSKDGTQLLCYPPCRNASAYTVGSEITSISDHAFYNCTSLTSLSIGNTCNDIADNAISGCDDLTIRCYQYSAAHIYAQTKALPFEFIATLNGVSISQLPAKLMYLTGDELDLRGLILEAEYTDGTHIPVTDYSSSGFSSARVGEKTVTVTYKGYSDTFTVTISEPENTVFTYVLIDDGLHAEITGYTGSGGSITLPAAIDNYPVTSIGDSAFSGNSTIVGIKLNSGLVNIGESAFRLCSNLTSISIPESVLTIGKDAFYGCYGLESVTFAEGLKSIGNYAFYNCYGLTSIALPDSVESLGAYAFYNCTNLANITVGKGVSSIGNYAFLNCTKLTNINVDSENTGYSSLNGVLYSNNQSVLVCYPSGRTSLQFTVPSSVRTIGIGAFNNSKLLDIQISRNVTAIHPEAFTGSNLTIYCYINTTAYTFALEHKIKYSVLEAQDPVSISILVNPSKMSYIVGEALDLTGISVAAVYPDSTLEVITGYTVSGFDSSRPGSSTVTLAYEGCTAQFTVSIEEPLAVTEFTYTVSDNKATVTGYTGSGGSITIPAVIDGYRVRAIGDSAFDRCTTITSVLISNGIEVIEDNAFSYCADLVEIKIPSSVETIGSDAFYQCTSLFNVTFSEGLKHINSYAFSQCSSLKYIILPESLVSIGLSAFNGCSKLESVTIPYGMTGLESYTFANCGGLMSVLLDTNITTIDSAVFSNSPKVTVYCYENSSAHSYCIAESVMYSLLDSNSEFSYTTLNGNVTIVKYNGLGGNVSIPETIDSMPVIAIGDHAFTGCKTVTQVTVPSSVNTIGAGAFALCPALGKTVIPAETTGFGNSYVFEQSPNVVIYCMEFSAAHNLARTNMIDYILMDNVTLMSIAVTTPPAKTSYRIGEELDLTGIVITASYSNATTSVIDANDCFVSGFDSNIEGVKTVIFTYNGRTASLKLNVLLPDFYYKANSDGTITITAYNGTEPDVVIPSVYEGKTVSTIGNGAFERNLVIQSVIIPASVKTIESRAFYSCTNLSSVTFRNGLNVISSYSFYGCGELTSITIPNSVTAIESYAFHDCSKLSYVSLGSGLNAIGYSVFRGCTLISSFNVSNNNENFVTDNGVLYTAGYETLVCYPPAKDATIYNIKNSTRAISEFAFYGCPYLVNITIPKTVTSIPQSFADNHMAGLTIRCYKYSTAYNFAIQNSILYVLLDSGLLTLMSDLSDIVIDSETRRSSGFDTDMLRVDQVTKYYSEVNVSVVGRDGQPLNGSDIIGTGCRIVLKNDNNEIIDSSEILIFGDIDGDGYIDGNDAFFVNLIVCSMLTPSGLSECERLAADATHDGVIDDIDVQLLFDCGTLSAEVSQS